MLIYGKQAVLEALHEGHVERLLVAQGVHAGTLKELEALARQQGLKLEQVPRIQLDQALKTTRHQGIVAQLPELAYSEPEAPFALARSRNEKLLLVLLDQISDPRNYGAIIRSAEVLGAHGVVTEERRSAPLSAVVAKTAAGATSHLPLVQVKNLPRYLQTLKERNVWIYGASGDAANTPSVIDWDRDAALVIGSEGTGMRRLVRDRCDDMVKIPMRGKVASLNASVAAGILLYAVQRARTQS
ncbi:MAG TPA: 23S rRNA (guanosine(2251)-2'-O)-methyltransferase RlmB [Trueperaceae bacterium]